MTTPEPVDETAAPPAETRGGNHLADITVPGEAPLPFPEEDDLCGCGDLDCGAQG